MQYVCKTHWPDVAMRLYISNSIAGNKLISVQTAKKEGDKSTKVTREFNADDVIQTMEIIGEDVTCIQIFKRIA